MSLFPAYSAEPSTSPIPSQTTSQEQCPVQDEKAVSCFTSFKEEQPILENKPESSASEEEQENKCSSSAKRKIKIPVPEAQGKSKKSKKVSIPIDFTGDEEYYVDKKAAKSYLTIETLHKPACPRYSRSFRVIGWHFKSSKKGVKRTRYFKAKKREEDDDRPASEILDEEEYMQRSTDFNRGIASNPRDMSNWVGLVELQSRAPYKWSKTALAERKIEIIERALVHNLGEETLYNMYVEIVNTICPSFEVSKLIDKLIAKDPNNYTLWNAQILTTQCSMARCIVPDVLKLYEKCMQKMYRKSQQDDIMIRLFTNCALFLRQSGLFEQFFALIKLALELNVSATEFNDIQPEEKDQHTLVEYEELVLRSGLPMNELWLRIEKLRQSYNYLPCPSSFKCTDPQRLVFNEDICSFIYPLSSRENSFYLVLTVLKLLKFPLEHTSALRKRFSFKKSDFNDSDAIEDILPVFLHSRYFEEADLYNYIYNYVKDLTVSPSYMNTIIGHDLYLNTLRQMLFKMSDCYAKSDEQKRKIFILLWMRFERMLLTVEKLSGKFTADYGKKLRSRLKKLLKLEANRNVLNFYTEFALAEHELSGAESYQSIFATTLAENCHEENRNSDVSHAFVTYAELLIKNGELEQALRVIICYALKMSVSEIENDDKFAGNKKLSAIQYLNEQVTNLIQIEKNVSIMELEQYFLPDFLVNLVKLKIYCQCLLGHKLEAIGSMETMLQHFKEQNDRHWFLREQFHEVTIQIVQWPNKNCVVSNVLIFDKLSAALQECPDNLFLLNCGAVLANQPWFKIRSLLGKSDSILSIIFLLSTASYRSGRTEKITTPYPYNFENYELFAKLRVEDILRSVINKKGCVLRKNALLWRLYLRSLSNSHVSFEKVKNSLLTALDECPWNKALYLDGTIYVPQELSHLQDLIIEKQLRIYALPEELEILRNDSV